MGGADGGEDVKVGGVAIEGVAMGRGGSTVVSIAVDIREAADLNDSSVVVAANIVVGVPSVGRAITLGVTDMSGASELDVTMAGRAAEVAPCEARGIAREDVATAGGMTADVIASDVAVAMVNGSCTDFAVASVAEYGFEVSGGTAT